MESPAAPPEVPAVETPTPAPETPVEASAEDEANSAKPDAELTAAAKTLRKNRYDERVKRKREENDDLARELARGRQLRSEWDRESRPAQPRTAAGPLPAGTATSERFSFPDYDVWAQHGDNASKPFSAWMDERDDARDVWKESRRAVGERREATTRHLTERASALDQMQEKGQGKYADFDAVVDVVLDAFRENPRAQAVSDFIATSKAGDDLVYRLGKDTEKLTAVSRASFSDVFRTLSAIESDILAPAKAPPPLTRAPAPLSKPVGAGASASTVDTNKPGTSLKDHIRIEEADIAERRRQGYRE